MRQAILATSVTGASAGLAGLWPACIDQGNVIRNAGQALFTDVGSFGGTTGCFIGDCKWSDKFSSISQEECARVCSIADGCEYWTFGDEDDETKCWLRSGDSGREPNEMFMAGAKECSPPLWPDCTEKNTVIRNANRALFFDATVFGAASGCFLSDCKNTDKFSVPSMEDCANVCSELPECNWWSFGEEDGEKKCWLRQGDDGREVADGFLSGSRGCLPSDIVDPATTSNVFGALIGSWHVIYSNAHATVYDITEDGFVSKRGSGRTGQLVVAGTAGDVKADPNFVNGFYLEGMHRDNMWEYVWFDEGILHVRHFCEDGNCKESSPEGSSQFCCSATGQQINQEL